MGQVLADLRRSMEAHAPGVVNDVGDTEEGGGPGQGSHDAWGAGVLVMKAVGVRVGGPSGEVTGWLLDARANACSL